MSTITYVYADDGADITHLVRQTDLVIKGERARTLCGDYGTADLAFGDETQSGITATCVPCLDLLNEPRPLSIIAADVRAHWPKVYFAARPYLDAMAELTRVTDRYYNDTAEEIVLRFLTNAATWRGDDARRIKAELRGMLR